MSSQPTSLSAYSLDVASGSSVIDISLVNQCTTRKRVASCFIDSHSPQDVCTAINIPFFQTSKNKKLILNDNYIHSPTGLSVSQSTVRPPAKKQSVRCRESDDVLLFQISDVVMTECGFCAMSCTITDSLQCEFCSERYHLAWRSVQCDKMKKLFRLQPLWDRVLLNLPHLNKLSPIFRRK